MNPMKVLGFVFLSGCLFLPTINVRANETTESQKQFFESSKHPIQNVTEAINVENLTDNLFSVLKGNDVLPVVDDFTDNLFLGLKDDYIVWKINGGGFLSSCVDENGNPYKDSETIARDFKNANSGRKYKLKAFTVSEAKDYYRKQMKKILAAQKK